MIKSLRPASQITAIALLVTVATQVLYITLGSPETPVNRDVVWGLEVVAFLVVAIFGLALVPARPVAGAAVAIGGVLNVVQAGMGLVMFGPLGEAGEAMAPAMQAVLSMAFLMYFAGKAAFALAALIIGIDLWRAAIGPVRILGLLAGLTGLIGLAINVLAMVTGMQFTFPAGGGGHGGHAVPCAGADCCD